MQQLNLLQIIGEGIKYIYFIEPAFLISFPANTIIFLSYVTISFLIRSNKVTEFIQLIQYTKEFYNEHGNYSQSPYFLGEPRNWVPRNIGLLKKL